MSACDDAAMPTATVHLLLRTADRVTALLEGPREAWTDATFDEVALELHDAQRAAVPAYDAWCRHELAQRGDGRGRVLSWHDVPAMPIAAYKELPLRAAGLEPVATWRSSGTTSADRSTHELVSTRQYELALDAGVAAALVPDVVAGSCAPLACLQLQPSAAGAPSSSLTHMFDRIRTGPWCSDAGVFVDASYALDGAGCWDRLAQLAADDTPVLVLATSFALAMLLDHAEEHGARPLQLPRGSRVVDTGGFKGRVREITRDELLDRTHAALGVAPEWCENEYGMAELSSQAWLGTVARAVGLPIADERSSARWTPPWLRVRVVDPVTLADVEDGATGLLVFHDLANVWSCAAVRSEDLGVRRGDGFELLGRAPGARLKGCSLQLEQLDAGLIG